MVSVPYLFLSPETMTVRRSFLPSLHLRYPEALSSSASDKPNSSEYGLTKAEFA